MPPFFLVLTDAYGPVFCRFAAIRYNRRIMFAARPFALNFAPAVLAGVTVRATITKTTTIKG